MPQTVWHHFSRQLLMPFQMVCSGVEISTANQKVKNKQKLKGEVNLLVQFSDYLQCLKEDGATIKHNPTTKCEENLPSAERIMQPGLVNNLLQGKSPTKSLSNRRAKFNRETKYKSCQTGLSWLDFSFFCAKVNIFIVNPDWLGQSTHTVILFS